jgi:hypothetical protein
MPFTNLEVAFLVVNELNRQDQGLWLYKVERHIDDKRWTIVRRDRELNPLARLDFGGFTKTQGLTLKGATHTERSGTWTG